MDTLDISNGIFAFVGFTCGFLAGAVLTWRERRARHGDVDQPNFQED